VGELHGVLDLEGKVVVEPQKRSLGDFLGGLARWRLPDRTWGYIDTAGKDVWRYVKD